MTRNIANLNQTTNEARELNDAILSAIAGGRPMVKFPRNIESSAVIYGKRIRRIPFEPAV